MIDVNKRINESKNHRYFNDWIAIGKKNPWICNAYDPQFNERSFYTCYTRDELKEKLSHGNWCLGTAFIYDNFCFINQVEGGDEFLVIRDNISFESISAVFMIKNNRFDNWLDRATDATEEQLKKLTY